MDNYSITLGLMGDVMIGRNVNDVISKHGYIYPWGNTMSLLKNTDFNLINLEAALTNSINKVSKTFNFKATPDRIKTLLEAGITAVNIANNHILDFSEEGLTETIDTLKRAGIKYVGAGENIEEAEKPTIITVKNNKIGILGFTDNESGWKANSYRPGVNYIDISNKADCDRALKSIVELRKEADIVIISIHWGPNMNEEPEKNFVDFAHAMIDHGAEIIHGHSAHNFQGIEMYKNKLILYDTGDFVDDYAVDPYFRNDHSFFFQISIAEGKLEKLTLIPVLISRCQVNLASDKDYEWSLNRMKSLSAKFGTQINDKGEILFN